MGLRSFTRTLCIASSLALAAGARPVVAQTWSSTLVVQPTPSPFISDWSRNPSIAQLTVFYRGSASVDYGIEAVIRERSRGLIGRARSPLQSVPFGPYSQLFTATTLVDWRAFEYAGGVRDAALRTGLLPEGEYELCTRLLSVPGEQLLNESCADFRIAYPDAPQLIAPANGSGVLVPQPAFQWMPANLPPGIGVRYRLRVARRLAGQAPQIALQSNVPQHEGEVDNVPFYVYPLDALPLEVGQEYVWQVEVLTTDGTPFSAGGRRSEIYAFTWGREGGTGRPVATSLLPDSLELVPGVAYLRGLAGATLTELAASYLLGGRATLEIRGPFAATVPVELRDLGIDRTALPAVRIVSGSLRGRLQAADIPSSVRGTLTELTDVSYTPSGGLSFGGALQLPGIARLPLDGRLSLGAAGLEGVLQGAAPSGGALVAVGDDPVRLRLDRASVSFPTAAVSVRGELELFGQALGCSSVSGDADAAGNLDLDVLCAPSRVVSLVPGVDRFALELTGIAGRIQVALATSRVTPVLEAAATLRLDAGVPCASTLELAIGADGVRSSNITPTCDVGGAADLGWLELALGGLRVERFAYLAGRGFDFAMRLDATPRIPALAALPIPSLAGVVLDRDGLRFPALDVPLADAAVTGGGFGFTVSRLRLPALTLAWTDWQAARPDAFQFGFDAALSFPELGGTAPSCLAGAPIALRDVGIREGRLSATLTARAWPAGTCALPLGPAAIELTELAGRLALSLRADGVSLEELPTVRGALRLPETLRCEAGGTIPLGDALRFAPNGRVLGRVSGLAPPCPIDLAAVLITMRDASLDLGDDVAAPPQAVLRAAAEAQFALAATPVTGRGTIGVDILEQRMVEGRLEFTGPMRLDLPREQPALSFELQRLALDADGLAIDGRNALLLPGGTRINTTFNGLTLDPRTLRVLAGEARFDAPFGFEVGLADGALTWRAVSRGADLALTAGLRLDLPEALVLDARGFRAAGSGEARMVFDGRTFETLASSFSDDFALDLERVAVEAGRLDLRLRDVIVATIDRDGFRPNLAVIGMGLLPAQLPVPSTSVAYLQVRSPDDNALLVDVETVDDGGVRVRTRPGAPVALVFPALQGTRAAAPRVEVAFDLTFDGLLEGVRAGRLDVRIPEAQRAQFDLSAIGIPLALDSIAIGPGPSGGATRVDLGGQLALFGARRGTPGAVRVSLDAGGTLSGAITLPLTERIPLVSGSDRVAIAVDRVEGAFDVNLPAGRVGFDLALAGGLELQVSATERTRAAATVYVSDAGVRVSDLELPDTGGLRRIDFGSFGLGLDALRVPRLEYVAGLWDFELALDVALEFPGLSDLRLPTLRGVLLTPRGLQLPEYTVPEFPVGTRLVDLGGFQVRPLAFRMAPLAFDWIRGSVPSDWGFGFDFELGFGGLPESAPPELRALRVSVLDAGYRNGRITGRIEPRELGTPVPLPLGGVAGIDITQIAGTLGEASGAQDVSVTVGGRFRLPESLRCSALTGDPTLAMPGATLTVSGAGRVRGEVTGLAPQCPLALGPLAVQITRSSLRFDVGVGDAQQALLALDGTLRLPPPPGSADSVRAAGSVTVDLIGGELVAGAIEITQPFGLGFPAQQPVLTFAVNRARLDTQGFTISGEGGVNLGDGTRVGVRFNDLALGLRDFNIRGGSATFTSGFALGAALAPGGGLTWQTLASGAPAPTTDGFRLVLPDELGLDASGLRIAGTARASVRVGDQALPELGASFLDGFALNFEPFGVRQGRVDFLQGERRIAYLDRTGFWPGDIFAVLPVPARLGLPDTAVAYLQLKEGEETVVETTSSPAGLTLRTRPGRAVRLGLPSLRQGAGPEPSVNVQFDVTVDPRTFAFVSGSVSATTPEGAQSLLPLRDLGLPLDITELAYAPTAAGPYGLRLGARLALPPSMGGLDVRFDSLTLSARGFSGSAEVGRFLESYDPSLAAIASTTLGEDLTIEVIGVRAEFPESGTPRVRLAGALKTPLFTPAGAGGGSGGGAAGGAGTSAAEAIFFTASVGGAAGFEASVDIAALEGRDLPLGVATFAPASIGGQPALGITANDSEFTVRLSGTFKVPSLARDFGVTVRDLSIGTRGLVIPDVRIATAAEGQQFELFGQRFVLKDSVGGGADFPALGFSYRDRLLTATMTGSITLFPGASYENTSRFWGLSVTSRGDVSVAGARLLSRSIPLIAPDRFTLDSVNIVSNQLRVSASVVLPEPLVQDRQRLTLAINSDGSVSGAARIVAVSDEAACCDGRQFIEFGIAKVRLRHLSMTLDAANPSGGGIEAVVDAYVGTDDASRPQNHIRIGNTSGGTVLPGLRIGFDGSVRFQNYALAREFDFDFEVLRLRLTEVAAPTTPGQFGVLLSGELSLAVSGVSGSLAFQRFGITNRGLDLPPDGISRGTLSIQGALALEINSPTFINSPTDVRMANPDGGTGDSITVRVSSLVRFGGNLTVGSADAPVFSGGVEEFLFYREVGAGTNIIVKRLRAQVQNVLDLTADFRFTESTTGFRMTLGAQALLKVQPEVAVRLYGAVSNNYASASDGLRLGMFLSVAMRIDLLPTIAMTELGAGFFYRPLDADIRRVYELARLRPDIITRLEEGRRLGGRELDFAAMLYAEISIVGPQVARGRVLVSVTSEDFLLYGTAQLLDQGEEKLGGGFFLQVGLRRAFAQGEFWVNVNYSPLIVGTASLEFFVFGGESWGVKGNVNINLLSFISATSELFVGPPGFLFSISVSAKFDVWIISISSGFNGTIWYRQALGEVGGYVEIYIQAELLGGVIKARASLRGAFLTAPSWMLYAGAALKVSAGPFDWEGSLWVKAQQSGWKAGLGEDATMNEMINRAQAVRGEMEAAKRQAEAAIEAARMAPPALRAYGQEELAAAYARLAESNGFVQSLVVAVAVAQERNVYPGSVPGLDPYLDWYRDNVLDPRFSPQLMVGDDVAGLDSTIAQLDAERPALVSRLQALQGEVRSLTTGLVDSLPGNPVRSASFIAPVTEAGTDEYGRETRRMTAGPTFDLDDDAARELTATVTANAERDAVAMREIADRIASIEALLERARGVLTETGEGSMLRFAQQYNGVRAGAQEFLARQLWLINARRDYLAARRDTLVLRGDEIPVLLRRKYELRGGNVDDLKRIGRARATALGMLLMTDTVRARFNDDASLPGANAQWAAEQAEIYGRTAFYTFGLIGLDGALTGLDSIEVEHRRVGGARLAAVEEGYGEISRAYGALATAHGNLVGSLVDAIDRYRFRLSGSPDLVPGADTVALRVRRDDLERLLVTPRVNWTSVVAVNYGAYSEQIIRWAGSHEGGVWGYSYNDRADDGLGFFELSPGLPGTDPLGRFTLTAPTRRVSTGTDETTMYFSGDTRSIRTWAVRPGRTATTQARTFTAGVRGGAGFEGIRGHSYTAQFRPGTTGAATSVQTYGQSDGSPPSAAVVSLMGIELRYSAARRENVAWVGRPGPFEVSWRAVDEQSGISEYRVGFGTRPDTADIRPMQNYFGRTMLVVDDIPARPDAPLYVLVQAVNGAGLSGPMAASPAILLDPTPPVWAASAQVRPGRPSSGVSFVSTLPAPSFVRAVAGCPVSPPPYPASTPTGAAVLATATSAGGSWGGSLTTTFGSGASNLVPRAPFAPTLPEPAEPVQEVHWDAASDAESGLVSRYLWRVDTVAATAYQGSGWTETAGGVRTATIRGLPLDYLRSFYVSVVPVNASGMAGAPIAYGPFQVRDPSGPRPPVFCASVGADRRPVIQMDTLAGDPESGVLGYDVRILSNTGVIRDFAPLSQPPTFTAAEIAQRTLRLDPIGVADGTRVFVEVRARNRRNVAGAPLRSGAVLVDATPPPTVIVTPQGRLANGVVRIQVSGLATPDAHSGLSEVQWAVGTTSGDANVIGWRNVSLVNRSGGGFFDALSSDALPALATLQRGQTVWLQVRSINGAGLSSIVTRVSFTIQ